MESPALFGRRYKSQLDAGTETKDAAACDFEITVGRLVVKNLMFLPASHHLRRQIGGAQHETQTGCPSTKIFLLPGKSRRPRCSSTWRYASSDVTERREDKILPICSSLISGRSMEDIEGLSFIGHEDNFKSGRSQGCCLSRRRAIHFLPQLQLVPEGEKSGGESGHVQGHQYQGGDPVT
jgi:hypothetical protein